MNTQQIDKLKEICTNFHLPTYDEIPDIGLYLEQTSQYINDFFAPIPGMEITNSMISNYVKIGLVARSVKKKYYREQIAYLIFITLAKSVCSMENICLLFELQTHTYETHIAYEYLRLEVKNVMDYVFGIKDELDSVGVTSSNTKDLLRTTIVAVAHKMYLDLSLDEIRKIKDSSDYA